MTPLPCNRSLAIRGYADDPVAYIRKYLVDRGQMAEPSARQIEFIRRVVDSNMPPRFRTLYYGGY